MASFDKCPVCGGEIVERKVEKVLRGGNHTEIVKIQAEVCLRCGERLYAPEVVKRFEEIRSKLEAKEMAEAQNTALRTKLDYEVWFLDFLEKRYDMVQDSNSPPVLRITSGDESCKLPARLEMKFEEKVFLDSSLMNAMMPLTFIASFKGLDMIFEWILEENCRLGKIQTVPWNFKKKVKLLKKETNLQLPSLFGSQPYLYTYARALFCHLLPYRNEVVHKNSFSVSKDTLTLSSSKQSTCLTLSSKQVDCLVRFVRLLVRALVGEIVVNDYKDRMIRHYLDVLAPVHGLETFNQRAPRFVHVELTAPKHGAAFPADLKQVRDLISDTFEDQEVFFDLKVRAVDGDKLIAKWYFAPEEVPDLDVMTFYEESHKKHREALVE